MTAALGIARKGFGVTLVERACRLGGLARRHRQFWDGRPVFPFLDALETALQNNGKVTIRTDTVLSELAGYKGNFEATFRQDGKTVKETFGTVLIATGAEEWQPAGLYGFGMDDRVLTQTALENLIRTAPDRLIKLRRIVMIQCVGSRTEERPYCSRVCCTQAVLNALALREIAPEAQIYIAYRDIRTYGLREDLYRAAREKGLRVSGFHQ
jgi:heterodisulfide reductase subunit A